MRSADDIDLTRTNSPIGVPNLSDSSLLPGKRLAGNDTVIASFFRLGTSRCKNCRAADDRTKTPFVGFQAGAALLQAVRSLSLEAETELHTSIDKALELAHRNPNDPPRINVLKQAQRELDSKKKWPKA